MALVFFGGDGRTELRRNEAVFRLVFIYFIYLLRKQKCYMTHVCN